MRKFWPVGLMCVVLCFACLSANAFKRLTPEEKDYIGRVTAHPLTFTVAKEDSDRLWAMAQAFIGKHSSMKIETISDYILETYNPYGTRYGYRIVRSPKGDDVEFEVTCLYDNEFTVKSARQNAHILAHYLTTGEIIPRLITR